ncbi:hypothetical protein BCR37DRAFT_352100 [Protomyces lactucae-debilis]|uniref:Uncharacterized protein n=1 Tax=Protomyces lactucae-debilis TaxID=2754530 RepID=A0A1Y2EV82_PROLT|nr:uncharacterized protein BCR37DRAFT_353153 [Protomyces lactucae-debilis]XP_040721800.1 uncharacterized protein BCR37DRAFT_353083 [Protomyces lactucae-debilis]XP_040722364.1 uncharacterized protein BCR37DRAFT_352100 [Protomyces lactucae-debilis]ORY72880.1 hypothetical protein BCR37DRAFT_353153 [Protomyces lactucae-debilis]ORY73273.1 hypothetical protein BCR37DRAFT_353083 [Protomyces lactucae-debilis]ORY75492.1 hypothetical protein BCR37DRAFT_352100 [Protomyces lactucae-debilis]
MYTSTLDILFIKRYNSTHYPLKQSKKNELKTLDLAEQKKRNCSNPDSHLVSHDSTNESLPCLTLLIGREAVFSWRYGRR